MIEAPNMARPFNLKQCFRLCLPALLIGLFLRICLVVAVPEAFNGSDTPSFTQASEHYWLKHKVHFDEKRRWLYPALLFPLPALPFSPARMVPLLQHALGLATIFGIGWITGNLTQSRKIWVPLVTIAAAVWPKMLELEHEVVAECVFLAAFVITAALALPLGSLKNKNRLFWFLVAAAAVAATKPHGRGIWFGGLVVAALVTRNPLQWGWKNYGAVALGVLVILTSGEARQADWLLLNSVLPLVNLEGQTWKEYRAALKPTVLKARENIDQYPWRQSIFKKPLGDANPALIDPVWADLTTRQEEFCKVCKDLAREAIRQHPFYFLRFTLTKACLSFVYWGDTDVWIKHLDPPVFWKLQVHEMEDRWVHSTTRATLYYRMDQAQFDELAKERATRTNWAFPFERWLERNIGWFKDNVNSASGLHWLTIGPMGFLTLVGLLICFLPSRFLSTMILWLPGALCLVTVHAVGDVNQQYVQPIEWIGLVLIAIGLDFILGQALGLFGHRNAPTAPDAAEAKASLASD